MRKKLPTFFYNPVSFSGYSISIISFGLIIFLTIIELLSPETKPYMGIITFIILPFFLLIGFGLSAYGIVRERKRMKKGISRAHLLPLIDLNNPKHRKMAVRFSLGLIFFLLISAFGTYKAYEFTETVEFCGTVCHSVMSPEYSAYEFSPHARVKCVECHIGSGAEWYIRSKLSGAYQVYAVLFNTYTKPIETPIINLRPAQGTCEQCHWPKHFLGEKRREFTYFLSDEKNTKWTLNLLMKTGGGNIEAGPTSGIHWHMNISHKVMYYPFDRKRQDIPWVSAQDADGNITIYKDTETNFDFAEMDSTKLRRMDCIDCHNRPSHIYYNPYSSVNLSLTLGWENPDLPFIKSVSVDALEKNYSTKEVALDSISIFINDFYSSNYPEIFKNNKSDIEAAIKEIQKIYSRNYYPSMGVDWKKFPNNIGHLYYKGCFRCHDGHHVSDDGQVLSRDCNTCHTILAQKFEKDSIRIALGGINYKHPVDIGEAWKETNCNICHGVAE